MDYSLGAILIQNLSNRASTLRRVSCEELDEFMSLVEIIVRPFDCFGDISLILQGRNLKKLLSLLTDILDTLLRNQKPLRQCSPAEISKSFVTHILALQALWTIHSHLITPSSARIVIDTEILDALIFADERFHEVEEITEGHILGTCDGVDSTWLYELVARVLDEITVFPVYHNVVHSLIKRSPNLTSLGEAERPFGLGRRGRMPFIKE
ncbi:hypothetical protein PQX77_015073 [Marasmius sp. AFHP31]|nr:hypothetical protein PQX77_015073 [Marasmius sp. AFHP31]